MRDFPDIYAQSLRAVGIHIMQANHMQVPMLQLLLCNTFKADSLDANTSVVTVSFIYACLEDLIMFRQQ